MSHTEKINKSHKRAQTLPIRNDSDNYSFVSPLARDKSSSSILYSSLTSRKNTNTTPVRKKSFRSLIRDSSPRNSTERSVIRDSSPRKGERILIREHSPKNERFTATTKSHKPRKSSERAVIRDYSPRKSNERVVIRDYSPRTNGERAVIRDYSPRKSTERSVIRDISNERSFIKETSPRVIKSSFPSSSKDHSPRRKSDDLSTSHVLSPKGHVLSVSHSSLPSELFICAENLIDVNNIKTTTTNDFKEVTIPRSLSADSTEFTPENTGSSDNMIPNEISSSDVRSRRSRQCTTVSDTDHKYVIHRMKRKAVLDPDEPDSHLKKHSVLKATKDIPPLRIDILNQIGQR
eukprot:TRINITY_DN7133_c0_g1_i1.p1 TRINITY_DN7133_c0_g1~~TRINITY_DN7133_c0_g1_i1.p1  ORF type:complete len:379 (-),score=19.58 TRINITY_DN7133_c0_g1_i1:29-1072(-)